MKTRTFMPPSKAQCGMSLYENCPPIVLPDVPEKSRDLPREVWERAKEARDSWRAQAYLHATMILLDWPKQVHDYSAAERRRDRDRLVKALRIVEDASKAFQEWNAELSDLYSRERDERDANRAAAAE